MHVRPATGLFNPHLRTTWWRDFHLTKDSPTSVCIWLFNLQHPHSFITYDWRHPHPKPSSPSRCIITFASKGSAQRYPQTRGWSRTPAQGHASSTSGHSQPKPSLLASTHYLRLMEDPGFWQGVEFHSAACLRWPLSSRSVWLGWSVRGRCPSLPFCLISPFHRFHHQSNPGVKAALSPEAWEGGILCTTTGDDRGLHFLILWLTSYLLSA